MTPHAQAESKHRETKWAAGVRHAIRQRNVMLRRERISAEATRLSHDIKHRKGDASAACNSSQGARLRDMKLPRVRQINRAGSRPYRKWFIDDHCLSGCVNGPKLASAAWDVYGTREQPRIRPHHRSEERVSLEGQSVENAVDLNRQTRERAAAVIFSECRFSRSLTWKLGDDARLNDNGLVLHELSQRARARQQAQQGKRGHAAQRGSIHEGSAQPYARQCLQRNPVFSTP